MCQEGHYVIEKISFYDDAKLGTDLTAEADRGLYTDLQVIVIPFIFCSHNMGLIMRKI